MNAHKELLYGYQFDPVRIDEAIANCRTALRTRRRVLIGVLNAAKVVNARRDRQLQASLVDCDMLLADGQSIVWASKLLGHPLPERVAGIDLFEKLLSLAHAENHSIYLLGARPAVLAQLKIVLGRRFPGLRIVGSRDGYFDETESGQVAEDIRRAQPDMLFLGMTSPRKEIFLGAFGRSLNVPILHGVGGSFDILAGQTRRAPVRWQQMGMEWAYRVLQEPRRLWWRYLRTNTAFLLLTVREMLRPTRAFHLQLGATAASRMRGA